MSLGSYGLPTIDQSRWVDTLLRAEGVLIWKHLDNLPRPHNFHVRCNDNTLPHLDAGGFFQFGLVMSINTPSS